MPKQHTTEFPNSDRVIWIAEQLNRGSARPLLDFLGYMRSDQSNSIETLLGLWVPQAGDLSPEPDELMEELNDEMTDFHSILCSGCADEDDWRPTVKSVHGTFRNIDHEFLHLIEQLYRHNIDVHVSDRAMSFDGTDGRQILIRSGLEPLIRHGALLREVARIALEHDLGEFSEDVPETDVLEAESLAYLLMGAFDHDDPRADCALRSLSVDYVNLLDSLCRIDVGFERARILIGEERLQPRTWDHAWSMYGNVM